MDDQACPRCKTTKYRNPSLKLMVNLCGHTLCESCVELLFLKGSGSCPECSVPLRRNNFRVQLFEDASVEKEVDIRRRILRDYNLKEEDFKTLEDYNDYLEEIEDIVYNLCNDIDIIETNKRIEAYKRENRDKILRNKMRLGRDENELEKILEIERIQEESRRQELKKIEKDEIATKILTQEQMIEELMSSEKDAGEIITQYSERVKKSKDEINQPLVAQATQFSTGIKFGRNSDITSCAQEHKDVPFIYTPPIIYSEGPVPPSVAEIGSKGYLKHVRPESVAEHAGGYHSILACQRALQECMQSLYKGTFP